MGIFCLKAANSRSESEIKTPFLKDDYEKNLVKKGLRDSEKSTQSIDEIKKEQFQKNNKKNEFPDDDFKFIEEGKILLLEKKNKELQEEYQKLKQNYEKTMETMLKNAVECEMLTGKAALEENENKRLKEKIEKSQKTLEETILFNIKLEGENKKLKEINETFERKLMELKVENDKIKEKTIDNNGRSVFDEEEKSERTIDIIERTRKDLEKNKGLEEANQKLIKKIANYKKKFEEKESNLTETEENLKITEENLKTTEENLKKTESKLEKLKNKQSETEETLEKTQKELEKVNLKLEKLKKKHKSEKSKVEALQIEKEDLEKEKQVISTKYKDLKQKSPKKDPPSAKGSKKSMAMKANFTYYDMVINIDSLVSKEYGWRVDRNENILNSINPKENYSIIGLVGRENIGKTFILNKICGFELPCGSNVNTKGISLKYANKRNLICLDSAGIGTPVYYYDEELLKKFGVTKEELRKNDDLKHKMINDRTLTDVFIQDFILEICEVILIVVGQLSQYDQKFIERVSNKYKAKKRIIVIHNFTNLFSVEDVEKKIEKDIAGVYDTVSRKIPNSDVLEFIEKINDKSKENVSHLILADEMSESGQKYNDSTFQYLKDILDTRVEKRSFNLIKQLKKFMSENYRLYFQFKKLPNESFGLKLNPEKTELMISTDGIFEVSHPIFNSLGTMVTNPPYEVFERNEKFICLIELPDLNLEGLNFEIDKKGEFACLKVNGVKKPSELAKGENFKIMGTRVIGEILCRIPLGPREVDIKVREEGVIYENGILVVEVEKSLEESLEL